MTPPQNFDDQLIRDACAGIAWPAALGKPTDLKPLASLGEGAVWAAMFGVTPAIIKISSSPRELLFYRDIAPLLAAKGLQTPRLLWSAKLQGKAVIVLERLPRLLPQDRWRVDAGVIGYLAKLHAMRVDSAMHKPEVWTEDMNLEAMAVFPDATAVLPFFDRARALSARVLAPTHLISGDPNGRNWGMREGSHDLVLFDWERVGLGTAALDLAGVAFGEPEASVFQDIAQLYCAHSPREPIEAAELARDMMVARVFIASVLLSRHTRGVRALPDALVAYYRSAFCEWLTRDLASMLNT